MLVNIWYLVSVEKTLVYINQPFTGRLITLHDPVYNMKWIVNKLFGAAKDNEVAISII